MGKYLNCEDKGWKIGFAKGTGRIAKVNVRSGPSTLNVIADVLSPDDRKIVEWNSDHADGDWYPVRVHSSDKGLNYTNGWVHSGFAVFEEIDNCKAKTPLIPNAGDASRFVDLPLPGYPTLALNGKERLVMSDYLKWLSLFIIHGPYELPSGGEVDLNQLLAAVEQLEATIKLALPIATDIADTHDDAS